jgi:uncharacterized protein DUF3828
MLTRRDILLGAAAAATTAPASAADAAATAFVTGIYDAYKGKDAHGILIDNDRAIRRYFEPSLATLIRKDQRDAARHGEAPSLDGDPFIDAQDWEIAAFDIAVTDTAPGKASATVKFVNAGEPKTIVLDLIKIKNDWRIADITSQRDGKPATLRALFVH